MSMSFSSLLYGKMSSQAVFDKKQMASFDQGKQWAEVEEIQGQCKH